MNTADVVSIAVCGSAVLLSGTTYATVKAALRGGYTVTLSGPSLRFEPLRLSAHPCAEAVAAPVPPGDTMTRKEAAAVLGIGVRKVRELGQSGHLTDVRTPGRATLVTTESVRNFQTARGTP